MGIHDQVGDGCYFNFAALDEDASARDFVDGGHLGFRGPDTIEEFRARCQQQWHEEVEREYGRR